MFISRDNQIELILKELDLSPDHAATVSNPVFNSSANAPYHNIHHLFTVTVNAYEASQYYRMNQPAQQVLILATLYHDVNHSAGEHDDEINVLHAMTAAIELIPQIEKNISGETLRRIVRVIQSTQHPSVAKPRNILECIIRDADILQTTEEDAEDFIHGLSKEVGRSITLESTVDFYRSHEMNTVWGDKKKQVFLKR